MNEQYPSKLLERAVAEFSKLPGVGRKTALRLLLHLLRQDPSVTDAFSEAMSKLRHDVKYCRVCHNISDTDVCDICSDPRRDSSQICVVENVQNVLAIEATQQYHGLYHVLGGMISPIDGIGPKDLEIESLVHRVEDGGVEEVILAISPTMEGETTSFFLSRKLSGKGVALTTLSQGIAVGDELEYADEVTLGRSLLLRVSYDLKGKE